MRTLPGRAPFVNPWMWKPRQLRATAKAGPCILGFACRCMSGRAERKAGQERPINFLLHHPPWHWRSRMARAFAFERNCIRRAISAILEPFDYEGYLRDSGISLLGSAQGTDVERLPGFSGNRIALWRARVHASIIGKIHQLWPESQATLMDAM